MHSTIRKFGNSKGVIIPAKLLRELTLAENDKVNINVENGRLTITPLVKEKYSLEALIKKCDSSAPQPSELAEWDRVSTAHR